MASSAKEHVEISKAKVEEKVYVYTYLTFIYTLRFITMYCMY